MEKVCVILGAGASHDVYNGGSPIINADFKPPLARDLFDIENHIAYWGIMQNYQGAKVLASVLAPMARSGEFNLEQELRRLAEHNDSQIREHFKHIPPYLRDLLVRASYEYVDVTNCYMQLVIELLAETPHEVLFLTLNYDNLLEQALTYFDKTYQFVNISDYCVPARRAKVVKLHGSINWYSLIGRVDSNHSWDEFVSSLDLSQKLSDTPIHVQGNPQPIRAVIIDKGSGRHYVYPVLTAPLAGKSVADMVCPVPHIETAREFLNDCRKFLIIGTSGFDEDLMLLLNEAIHVSRPVWVSVVGDDDSRATETLDRFRAKVRALWEVPEFRRGVYGRGFRRYVSDRSLQAFVRLRIDD